LAELEAEAGEGILFAGVEDAEMSFDEFEVTREDVLHEALAGFGEADDGDAAAAAGNVLERAMQVGVFECDGRKSGGDLAEPAHAGKANDGSADDGAAHAEAMADFFDGLGAFAVEEFEETEVAEGEIEGGERAAELRFHPFGGVDEDGAGAEGALGSVAVGEAGARGHGRKLADPGCGGYSRFYGGTVSGDS